VKNHVVQGHLVIIGVFTNEYLFYEDTDTTAGDSEYDHIVPVVGVSSNTKLTDTSYKSSDVLYFSDNGLWGELDTAQYIFSYSFSSIQKTRKDANSKTGEVYSLKNDGVNYGIAITGLNVTNNDTVPIVISTDLNYELPEIKGSTRPKNEDLTLTVSISAMKASTAYNLYLYTDWTKVPTSSFNTNKSKAAKTWSITSSASGTYEMTYAIKSDTQAFFRCVLATAL